MRTPTILIIGGKDKGNDYNEIKDLVKKKCVGLVYLGADNKSFMISLMAWEFLLPTHTV